MKLSKTVLILLAFGIFVILVASLNMAYSQQGEEQSRLNQELFLARQTLAKYSAKFSPEKFSSQQGELESQLLRAESKLETAQAHLRQSIDSIEVTDTLFKVAETCDVQIIEISSTGLTSKELEGGTYSVLSLRAKVEGDVPNLINFILELSKEFRTGVVGSVEINVPEVTEEEGEIGKPSTNLTLLIHTYEGD